MRLLLDTHLALWWQGMLAKVPAAAKDLIENSEEAVYISRASLWEMAIKIGLGKLAVDLPRFRAHIHADGFSILPIEDAHILKLAELPTFADHKDPFDCLLVAQSQSENLILLTVDNKLGRYGSTVRIV